MHLESFHDVLAIMASIFQALPLYSRMNKDCCPGESLLFLLSKKALSRDDQRADLAQEPSLQFVGFTFRYCENLDR